MQPVWGARLAGDESALDDVERAIEDAHALYYRLVFLVGPPGSGKTRLLDAMAQRDSYPLLRVGVTLSEMLLPLTALPRGLQAARLFAAMIAATDTRVVLLDNLEILFDVSLKLDPLRCLQASARNRTIVAAWPGRLDAADLVYGAPDHAEYKRYDKHDLLIIPLGQS